jgi:hypothetical protein
LSLCGKYIWFHLPWPSRRVSFPVELCRLPSIAAQHEDSEPCSLAFSLWLVIIFKRCWLGHGPV